MQQQFKTPSLISGSDSSSSLSAETEEGGSDVSSPLSSDNTPTIPSDALVATDDVSPEKKETLSRESLRQYMREHSLKGVLPMPKERTPFIGENVAFSSPLDPEVIFQIKRFGNREVMAYRDANAAVRYIMEDGEDGRLVTEKDYPMGTMRLDTVVLGLANWNITNGGTPVPLTRENILHYLDPNGGELDAIYDKILEVNPILLNNGASRKNS